MSLNVVVSGMPNGFQGDSEDGLWLSEELRDRILSAVPGTWLEHIPVSRLHAGQGPERPPHAVLVESSGTLKSWEREKGILKRPGLEQLVTPELRLVQSASAGAEHLVDLIPEGVVLTNASGVHATAIAETVMAAVLSDAKWFDQRKADQSDKAWRQLPCRELAGASMVVLGTGHIGSAVAQLARAFSIRTVGVNRSGRSVDGFERTVPTALLTEAVAGADYVVVAAPLTSETERILDPDFFAVLKPSAYLVNVSRGGLIDDPSMIEALGSGQLRGAFLDTHTVEPLPQDSPLWTLSGVQISPHDSHASQLLGERHVELFIRNLSRLAAGEELINVVDVTRGY